ncbi:MAG: transporter substrate-binding protein [Edaphobacter sp.]|nr:transporter substrate-binding protein [Edaphobacter sp.]
MLFTKVRIAPHRARSLLAGCLAIFFGGQALAADSYPSKAVRLIVPFAPGGTTDLIARVVAQKMALVWAQPIVIDNRGGATGQIGTEMVANSAPDGYTILMNSAGLVTDANFRKLPYNTAKAFTPITNAANTPYFLFANPAFPVNSVKELVALAKAKPDQVTFGSSGIGGAVHLSGEMFNALAGVRLMHVPYKGTGAAITALVAGEVDLVFVGLPAAQQFVKNGRLKIIATAGSKRSSFYPDIPTIAEAGVPGYAADNWFGFFGPAGLPADVEHKIAETTVKALATPEVQEQLRQLGAVPVGNSPAEFKADFQSEIVRWGRVIHERGIKQEK